MKKVYFQKNSSKATQHKKRRREGREGERDPNQVRLQLKVIEKFMRAVEQPIGRMVEPPHA